MFSWSIWLLILGIFLMVLAGILAGGMQETTGGMWVLFAVGLILTLVCLVWILIDWSKDVEIDRTSTTQATYFSTGNVVVPYVPSPVLVTPTEVAVMPPIATYAQPILPQYNSPIGIPSKTAMNIPQAQRGFTSTNMQLSSLSPITSE